MYLVQIGIYNQHDIASTCLESILERPKIHLVHCLVIDVAGNRRDRLVVRINSRIAV
jgi:hypothetical protein